MERWLLAAQIIEVESFHREINFLLFLYRLNVEVKKAGYQLADFATTMGSKKGQIQVNFK